MTTAKTTTRQNSSIDIWTTVDVSRLDQDVHIIPLNSLFQRFHTDQLVLCVMLEYNMAAIKSHRSSHQGTFG